MSKVNRKESVRKKLFKIRQARQQNNKVERETQRLKRETDKISNKGFTIRMPTRTVGVFVPVETDISQDTVVSYIYAKSLEYAKVLNPSTLLLLSEAEAENAVECTFKNGRLKLKKPLDNSVTDATMTM